MRPPKHHPRRIIGNKTLTFEELYSLRGQIESCLNTKPLEKTYGNFRQNAILITPRRIQLENCLR